MRAELEALYTASLLNHSHAAFYRLPGQEMVNGYISKNIISLEEKQEGFLIQPFNPELKAMLIGNDISFELDDSLHLNFNVTEVIKHEFLQHLQTAQNATTNELTPFHTTTDVQLTSRDAYMEMVNVAKQCMFDGEFKKVVLSRVKAGKYSKTKAPAVIFEQLCNRYPEAFVSLISSPLYGTWIGASPETLLEQNGNDYSTMALAGTKKSGKEIEFAGKEKEEQNIIKDYISDSLQMLGISTNASTVAPHDVGGLVHLKTNLNFQSSLENRLAIARELHPTPAVGGLPKAEAIAFIHEKENYDRELYAGFIGPMLSESMSLFVNIRCMQWRPEFPLLFAGAGITAASEAFAEWEETENKMNVIGQVL